MAWRNVRSSDPRKKAIVAALIEQGFNETGQRGTKVTSVKERHGGRFHGDVLVYQSHCNRAVWLRLGHFEVSLAGQSENGYPQVISGGPQVRMDTPKRVAVALGSSPTGTAEPAP
jgi:hypothetical protein